MKIVAGFVSVLALSVVARAGSYADSLFVEANRLYGNQYYSEAAELYSQVMSQGYTHTNLYYNLGNAYYQLGELGSAIWAYEKGLELKPRDSDLKFNLSVVNARIVDRVRAPEPIFLLRWYGALKGTFSPSQWLLSISFLFLSAAVLSAAAKLWRSRMSEFLSSVAAAGLVVVIVLSVVFADVFFELSDRESGVVVAKEGRVYAAPSRSSNLLFVVHEGTKAEITSRQHPWVEIQLIDGKKGWLTSEQLRQL